MGFYKSCGIKECSADHQYMFDWGTECASMKGNISEILYTIAVKMNNDHLMPDVMIVGEYIPDIIIIEDSDP